MRVIDLFAGCGGMSLGFEKAGYEICAAFDNWRPAIEVYQQNFKHPITCYDLGNFAGDTSLFTQYQPDMIIGGPPCQDFSSAGKRDESLGRADLTISFAEIVGAARSTWFVMENVERAVKTNAYACAVDILRNKGYGLTEKILDASLCGVPQKRKRLFLIGELNGFDDVLSPYLDKNLSPFPMTIRDYFGNCLQIEHYYRHPRSYKRRGIFSVDEPSPTIRGVNRPLPDGYPGHPGDTAPVTANIRPLTTQERWMIQTFPKDFIFEGTKSDIEQMVGNAVPVKLAEYVANCIHEYTEDQEPVMPPMKQLSLL